METLIQERVTQKENELNATYDERLLNYEERYAEIVAIPDAQLTLSSLPARGTSSDNSSLRKTNSVNFVRPMRLIKPSSSTRVKDKVKPMSTSSFEISPLTTPFTGIVQEAGAQLAEMDMMAADLERSNARVAAVERRNVRSLLRTSHDSARTNSTMIRNSSAPKSRQCGVAVTQRTKPRHWRLK